MRLLHFNDHGKLGSTIFTGQAVPPYAILSHRWGDSEVLFEDLDNDVIYLKKEGYRKIEFCAKQADKDHLEYFWIDTCCIDKWNLQELSDSINSMYEWYRNATECYVFLPDVSVPTEAEVDNQSTWEASFRASKWFTRGWTLQELIAPVSVNFFSSNGFRIGDKRLLEQLISEITSIPVEALNDNSLDNYTTSDRIMWARDRDTTEEEDAAYCLLGILGISMHTSYGEGKDKAMARLHFEVQANNRSPFVVPFSRNDRFVGRESQLAELEQRLFGDIQTKRLGVLGPPGAGKTQLVLELAHRTIQKHPDCSVFWIDADDMDSCQRSYTRIAQKLDIPGWGSEGSDAMRLVKHHLDKESTGQWIIIYDSTGDLFLDSTEPSSQQKIHLVDELPQSKVGSVVFTITDSYAAEVLALHTTIELKEMTPAEAKTLLTYSLNTPILDSEQSEIMLLLEELSYVPLAIVQAAACLNNAHTFTLRIYRLHAVDHREEAADLVSTSCEDIPQHSRAAIAIITTFLISLYHIQHSFTLAAERLFLAACLNQKDIPIEFLGRDPGIEGAIRILHNFALIVRRPAESSLDIHPLVHLATQKWLQHQNVFVRWNKRATMRLLHMFPEEDPRKRNKWRRLLPHAKRVLSCGLLEQCDLVTVKLQRKCAQALTNDGQWDVALEIFERVVEMEKELLGAENSWTLSSMEYLAWLYTTQQQWEKAEELRLQTIDVSSRVLGEEHRNTLACKGNLAANYQGQRRWKEAQALDEQTLAIMKAVLGEEHPDTLKIMSSLAIDYNNQNQLEKAERLQARAVDIGLRVFGDEDPVTLQFMGELILTYHSQCRWSEAATLGLQVLQKRRIVLGNEHPHTMSSMRTLALAWMNQDRWSEAEEMLIQLVEICSKVRGPEYYYTLLGKSTLGSLYTQQGLWKHAEELQVPLMEVMERVLGREHPQTIDNLYYLARGSREQGYLDTAISLMEECTALSERCYGPQHWYTINASKFLEEWRLEKENASA
jgi:tetratricopeptide (TPR) repeat protein